MISGIGATAYSVYSGETASIYGSAPLSDVKNNQKPKDAENTKEEGDIEDTVSISDEAKNLLAKDKAGEADKLPAEKKAEQKDGNNTPGLKTSGELTPEQQQEVEKLKQRDAEVRAHEQAHIAAAAGLSTSAPTYTYQTGPDGKKYAVGGEVNVSFTESGNPETDLRNAEAMKNSALAPSDPSSQDQSVAGEAEKLIQKAQQEISQQQEQQKAAITNSSTAKTLLGAKVPE